MTKQLPATLFERVLEESPDAALIIDDDGNICYMNAALQPLSGYAPNEVLGQPLDGLLPASVAAIHHGFLQNYISTGAASKVLGHVREFAIRHRTGETIPILLKALDLGVVDGVHYFGAFMVDMRARRAQEEKTAALLEQLEQEAMTDSLTALPNRRAFDAEAERVLARGRRHRAPTSIGIADIDLFKQVNDRYGHPVGDLVLCEVAKTIESAGRGADFVARTGGEEFSMLFPDTPIKMARLVAERMRRAVEAASVTTPDGDRIHVTISVGLAALAPDATPAQALALADAALYQAKRLGRNRIETGSKLPDPAAPADLSRLP